MIELEPKILERIDNYLMERMSPAERAQFEADLQSDTNLAEAFNALREIHHAIGYQNVRHTLQTLRAARPAQRKRGLSPGILIAVAACILICFGIFYVFIAGPSEDKKLYTEVYTEYYTRDPGLPTLMDAHQEDYTFYQGMVDYKVGEYHTALSRWESLEGGDRYRDTLAFYMAMAHLALEDEETAAGYLDRVSETGPFYQKRQWYLALIALNQRDIAHAQQLLESLAARPGIFQDRAQELSKRLGVRRQ